MDESRSSDSDQKKLYSTLTTSSSLLTVDILEQIFLRLPHRHVVGRCRLVCHQWKEVADSESFWRERCRREGYHPRDASKIPKDWRDFYFLCKERRNLLRNTRGEDGLNGWKLLKNGGDGWIVTKSGVQRKDETLETAFVTSFEMCIKSQLIDLKKEGYHPSFMDHFQPDIRISDWYNRRTDCGSEYRIWVELLNRRKELVQIFAPETIRPDKQEWLQMTHVFQNYGPGVAYIRFTHGGKDLRYWKGHYGIHLTDSRVEICLAMNT